ncbi:MAG: DEAD/DEAH box helicase, partial [Treponema sp.]|nr:DEAD/DEAH box helicase [Treponema sp.]
MNLPFDPLVSTWFTESFGKATAVQEEAWPLIAQGRDVLAIAPTGSGKTLTAFLSALSRFIDGSWDPQTLCVLYVSPLKALNEDIRRNLIEPVEALKQRAQAGNPVFGIRVETRSGDTPQAERRRFLVRPPSILAITPESLAIMLLNPKGREILSGIKCLVIDEIHAVMGTKRGAFLSCQIDRLSRIIEKQNTGSAQPRQFQRIALSATVNPPETAAEFAGGIDKAGKKQPLAIVNPPIEKKIHFTIEFPPEPKDYSAEGAFRYGARYAVLVRYIIEKIR